MNQKTELQGASVCFWCLAKNLLKKSVKCMALACILNASELPLGRGWSPHIWSIIEGATELTVSLISAEDSVALGHYGYNQRYQSKITFCTMRSTKDYLKWRLT